MGLMGCEIVFAAVGRVQVFLLVFSLPQTFRQTALMVPKPARGFRLFDPQFLIGEAPGPVGTDSFVQLASRTSSQLDGTKAEAWLPDSKAPAAQETALNGWKKT